jgi:hypothetical protein
MRVVCVCDSTGALARSRKVVCHPRFVFLWWLFFFSVIGPLEQSLHAPFIVSRRCRVTKCWPREGLIRWRHYLYRRGMALVLLALLLPAQACAPLLREWYLCLNTAAMCYDIHSPTATKCRIMITIVATCPSLRFD